jgi:stearoyl-CoA desaturase (delta-9 desaturase)
MNFIQSGLLDLPWWAIVIATLGLTHITIASVTIYLHRHQSHNSLTLHPVVSHFFRFWLWITTGMQTKEWVAIHRKHHAKCETTEDPHSPQVFGIKKVLLEGSELYRKESKNQETLDKYGHGTPDDWLERHVYTGFPFMGIVLMLLLDVLMFGAIGITVFAVQMIWIPITAAGVINGIGHYLGYRNFETKDASRNIVPWGILIGGEELHNNHHAYASSARLSNKWWEFDIGWLYIRIMSMLGLAKIKKMAAKVCSEADKHLVDMDTVSALVRHRFHIVKLYGRKVIRPVIRQERNSANEYCAALFKKVRKLMTREDIKLDVSAQAAIAEAMVQSQTLATVYEFKQKLKALWDNSKQNQTRRLERLQNWCAEAEQTGIEALEEFSRFIRGYTEIRMLPSQA